MLFKVYHQIRPNISYFLQKCARCTVPGCPKLTWLSVRHPLVHSPLTGPTLCSYVRQPNKGCSYSKKFQLKLVRNFTLKIVWLKKKLSWNALDFLMIEFWIKILTMKICSFKHIALNLLQIQFVSRQIMKHLKQHIG